MRNTWRYRNTDLYRLIKKQRLIETYTQIHIKTTIETDIYIKTTIETDIYIKTMKDKQTDRDTDTKSN